MTRAFTRKPVWTWVCDSCGDEILEVARRQELLPNFGEMEMRGWLLAKVYGDMCPKCQSLENAPRPVAQSYEETRTRTNKTDR